MNQKFYAHSSDFCFILAFKASICRSSACCFIFSCFSWSFFLFFSSSCCSANFFARIFSRISNGGSERTEMLQLSEGLWHKQLTPPELLLQGLHQLQHLIVSSGQKQKGIVLYPVQSFTNEQPGHEAMRGRLGRYWHLWSRPRPQFAVCQYWWWLLLLTCVTEPPFVTHVVGWVGQQRGCRVYLKVFVLEVSGPIFPVGEEGGREGGREGEEIRKGERKEERLCLPNLCLQDYTTQLTLDVYWTWWEGIHQLEAGSRKD